MRFPAEDLGRIRRGEITIALRPFEGKPSAYHPADRFHFGVYVIEAVRDERTETDEGVTYERVVQNMGEHIEVTARTRMVLNALAAEQVEAAGYEDLAQLVDAFCTDRGGPPEQSVWVIEFKIATDLPRLLAHPNWSERGHGDYVRSGHDTLPNEPEGVDDETLTHFAKQNRERFQNEHAKRVGEDEARALSTRLKNARKRAARTGVDVTLEVAHIEFQIAEIERQAEEAA